MNMFAMQIIEKRRVRAEVGFIIPEVLVSMTLLGIVIAAVTNLVVVTMHSNTAARSFSVLNSEIQDTIDGLRSAAFNEVLDKFATSYIAITDGQVATETINSSESRSSQIVTYTAVRSSNESAPEAVRVQISVQLRRGILGNISYDYQTVVSSAR